MKAKVKTSGLTMSTMSIVEDMGMRGRETTTRSMRYEGKANVTIATAGVTSQESVRAKARAKVKPEEEQEKVHLKEENKEEKLEEERVRPTLPKVEAKLQAKQDEKQEAGRKAHVGTAVRWGT